MHTVSLHRARQSNVEFHRADAQHNHHKHNHHIEEHLRIVPDQPASMSAPYPYGEDAAKHRRHHIEMGIAHHHRHLIDEHIANHPAAHRRERTQKHCGHARGVVQEGLTRAVHREQAKCQRIDGDHGPFEFVDLRMHHGRNRPGGERSKHRPHVGDSHRW